MNSIEVEHGALTGSRLPRDSPRYCSVGGVEFPRFLFVCFVLLGWVGGIMLIHFKKKISKDKDDTYLCGWVSDVLLK